MISFFIYIESTYFQAENIIILFVIDLFYTFHLIISTCVFIFYWSIIRLLIFFMIKSVFIFILKSSQTILSLLNGYLIFLPFSQIFFKPSHQIILMESKNHLKTIILPYNQS